MKAQNLIFIVVLVAIFYFLLIVPNRRQQKKRQDMMKQLGIGAEVVSAGGIYGEVTEVLDDSVMLEISDGVEIKIDRRSIVRILEPGMSQEEEIDALTGGQYVEDEDEDSATVIEAEAEEAEQEPKAVTDGDETKNDKQS